MLQYLNKVLKKIQSMQERRATYFLLHHLSDQQLKDIGVSRNDLNQKFYNT